MSASGNRDAGADEERVDPLEIFRTFGPPPVVKSERIADYNSFRDRMIREIDPVGWFECWHCRRYVDLNWEALRYARCEPVLIDLSHQEAIRCLIEEYGPCDMEDVKLDVLAKRWFTDVDARAQILAAWQPFGISEDSVEALALSMRSPELARIGDTRARKEAQAAMHLREIEHRRQMRQSGGERVGSTPRRLLKAADRAADIAAPGQA